MSKEQFPPTIYLKLSVSLFCICGSDFVLIERLHEPIGGNFSFLLNQHFSFSFTLITQALCLSFHNPKVWKPYLHYALSAVLQKYRFKALVFPLLHVSNNFCIRTGTGALLCLKFSLLKKIHVPSRADKLKEKNKIVITKKKCWRSQFTVVLWDHNLKKQHLLSFFLKQRSLLHPSHLQEGRKRIKRSCLIRVVRMKGQDKQLILQVHRCPIWLCSPCAHWTKGFFLEVSDPTGLYHWKIIGRDVLEIKCRQQEKSYLVLT